MRDRKICVVGLGYIGLPTSALFAKAGFDVQGVDVNESTVATINSGSAHIVEPELDFIVAEVVGSGKLKASLRPERADCFILAVPTPFKGDHEPDLSYVEAATRSIAPCLEQGNLVILESTSPVGTSEMIARMLADERPDLTVSGAGADRATDRHVHIAHCPERVLPGQILRELVENDRVIGGIDQASAQRAKELYGAVTKGSIHTTTTRIAEMCKLTENAFRDVNIAFANELSFICDKMDIDVWELIRLARLHPRVNILNPGPGVGGHCIAVDPWFIVHAAPSEARLIHLARQVNDRKPDWVVAKVIEATRGLKSPTIACLGLAYKADVDDLRESPSVKIVRSLAKDLNARLLVVEPYIELLPKSLLGLAELVSTDSAIEAADVIVLLVDHTPFKQVSASAYAEKKVIDTRGLWRNA